MGFMTDKMRLSHSQQKSLHGCTLGWWINRRARMPGNTWWSTIAGSCFHQRVEHFLLEGDWPEESIADHMDRLVYDQLFNTPYLEEDIRVSKQLPPGLKAADHPHGFNKAAAVAAIPIWIHKWRKWMDERRAEGWVVLGSGDDPVFTHSSDLRGVELEVNYTLGGHPVIGSIDCVLVNIHTEDIWLVDWKAGRSKPDDTSQLDGYRIGFEALTGIRPDLASFFMVRNGREHLTASLPTFTQSMLDVKFREAGVRAKRAEAGDFELDYTECNYLCSVRAFCPVKGGTFSNLVALPTPTVRPNSN